MDHQGSEELDKSDIEGIVDAVFDHYSVVRFEVSKPLSTKLGYTGTTAWPYESVEDELRRLVASSVVRYRGAHGSSPTEVLTHVDHELIEMGKNNYATSGFRIWFEFRDPRS